MFLFSAKTSALSLILTFPQKMLRAFFSRFCWDNTFSVIRITTSLEFLETWKCRGILQRSGKGHRVRKSELVWSEIFDCDILACNNMLVSLKNALQLNILLHLFDIFVYTSDVQVDFGHLLNCCENFVTSRIGVNNCAFVLYFVCKFVWKSRRRSFFCVYSGNPGMKWSKYHQCCFTLCVYTSYATSAFSNFVCSGFVFLRLLCPAILNPKQFNLITGITS